MERTIGVTVSMPETPEGIAALEARLLNVRSIVIGKALNNINAPLSAKKQFIESLHGIVPWDRREGRNEEHRSGSGKENGKKAQLDHIAGRNDGRREA